VSGEKAGKGLLLLLAFAYPAYISAVTPIWAGPKKPQANFQA